MPVAFSMPRSLASLERSGSFISFSTRMSIVSAACVCSGRRICGRGGSIGRASTGGASATAAAACSPFPFGVASTTATSSAAAGFSFGFRDRLGFSAFSSGGVSTAAAVASFSNSVSLMIKPHQRRDAISRLTSSIPFFVTTEQGIIAFESMPSSLAISVFCLLS